MTPENFCYWLQGHVELGGEAPSKEQWALIKAHLQLVFNNVTKPSIAVSEGEPKVDPNKQNSATPEEVDAFVKQIMGDPEIIKKMIKDAEKDTMVYGPLPSLYDPVAIKRYTQKHHPNLIC